MRTHFTKAYIMGMHKRIGKAMEKEYLKLKKKDDSLSSSDSRHIIGDIAGDIASHYKKW